METTPFVKLTDIAAYFSVSQATARIWARSGLIPCVKVGNVYRFRLPEVEAALIEHSKKREVVSQPIADSTDM
jgi:excisionase family DNA binding protein